MISRLVPSPSICLTCRRGFVLRTAARPADNVRSRAYQPLRFASGSAVRTKESVEALLSGAVDFGNPQASRVSGIRSQETIEALLSGAAEFEHSPEKKKRNRLRKPKHAESGEQLPVEWTHISRQNKQLSEEANVGGPCRPSDVATLEPLVAAADVFQFDFDDGGQAESHVDEQQDEAGDKLRRELEDGRRIESQPEPRDKHQAQVQDETRPDFATLEPLVAAADVFQFDFDDGGQAESHVDEQQDEAGDKLRRELEDGRRIESQPEPRDKHQAQVQDETRPDFPVGQKQEARLESLGESRPEPRDDPSLTSQVDQQNEARIDRQDEPRVDNKQDEPRVDNKQDEPRVDKRDEDGGDEQCLPPPDRPFKSNHGHKFQHASLGVVSLGKPAVALITKDPDVSRRHKRYVRRLKLIDEDGFTGLPLVYQDVLPKTDGLDAEAPERLRLIFDELRPKDTTALREKDVKRLAKKLVDAFTMQQLVTYYKEDMAHGLQVHHMPTYEWIVEHEPWQGIRAISLSRLKPKNRQAILIVTQKWKLDVEEQVEGQGTMVVRLKPDTYKLVAQPSSWVLRSLNANYFDPSNRERIALYPATCRLIIHSRKSTAHTILARMDEMLHHTTTKRVSVKDVDKDNLTEAALDELGRITNTSLQYHSAESEISVSWIPDEKVGEVTTEGVEDQGQQRKRATPGNAQTEDAADIVLRLLSARQAPAPTKSVQIITPEGESNGQGLALMAHHRDIRALTWRDKMRQWSRCVMPISSGTSTDTSQPRAPLSHLVSLPKATKALKKVVDGEATHQLSAAFGHLLHLQPHVRAAKTAGNHRVLSPVVPHPASLTSLGAEGHDAVQRLTAIMLNFAPEPTTGLGADIPPQIRLRLPVDNEANLSAFTLPDDSTLEAVFPSFCHDILLPAEDVDVRLLQQRTLPLDARQKPLQEFLSRSEFNLLQGRLRTPSRTKLSLPTRWLAGAKKKAGRKAKSTADQTSSSSSTTTTTTTTDVPFLFTGLEIHQTIDLPQGNNYLLRYSSVEAGHLSGQRQQLSLHASSHGQALSPSQVADFVGAVDNIVRGGLFPWHDGHRLAKSKSRERFRESMLDDPLDDTQVAGDNSWKRDLHHPAYPSSSFSPSRSSRPSPSPSFSSHYPSRHRAAPTG